MSLKILKIDIVLTVLSCTLILQERKRASRPLPQEHVVKLIEGRYKSKEMSKKVQDAILEQYKKKYAKKTLRRPKKYRLCKLKVTKSAIMNIFGNFFFFFFKSFVSEISYKNRCVFFLLLLVIIYIPPEILDS